MEAKAATSRRCLAVSGLRVVFLTLFFIALSFPPASPPRRNDANCLIRFVITVFNIVGYQQQQYAIHRSNRFPSPFSALNPTLFHHTPRFSSTFPSIPKAP